jgi:hypothetical protein
MKFPVSYGIQRFFTILTKEPITGPCPEQEMNNPMPQKVVLKWRQNSLLTLLLVTSGSKILLDKT